MDEKELDPPALERLGEISAPTRILVGELDLDAIAHTAQHLAAEIPDAHRINWPDTAHLPSMERPDDFLAPLRSRPTP